MILLRTPRAYLSRLSPEYLDRLVRLDSDPDVMRYINGGLRTTRQTMADKLPHWVGHYEDDRPSGFWAIVAYCLAANRASIRVMEKCGMYRDREFVYAKSTLPMLPEAQRLGIRYRIDTLSDESRDTGSTSRS